MRVARSAVTIAVLAWASAARADGFWDTRPVHGGQVAVGAGVLGATVSSSSPAFSRAGGPGMQLIMDVRLTEALAWDLRLGGFWTRIGAPAEISYPADDGDYALASTGLHYDFYHADSVVLWAGAEVTLHYGQMAHYFYSAAGFGFGPSFGIDVRPPGPFLVRIGAHPSWATLESNTGDALGGAFVFAAGADLLYVFR